MPTMQDLTYRYIDTALRTARFPWDTADWLLASFGPDDHTPIRFVVDQLDCNVRATIGSVANIDALRDDAARMRVAIDRRLAAKQLEQEAAQHRDAADEVAEDAHYAAEKAVEQTRSRADDAKERAEERKAKRIERAEEQAAQKKEQAKAVEAETKEAAEDRRRRQRASELANEEEALRKQEQALATKKAAKTAEQAAKEKKAARA